MVHGRFNEAWDRHSHLLAMLANAHRDPKRQRRPYSPKDFHPTYLARRSAGSLADLKDIFLAHKARQDAKK